MEGIRVVPCNQQKDCTTLSIGSGDRLCRAVGILIVTAFAFVSLFLENESMLDYVFMSAFRAGFWHLA